MNSSKLLTICRYVLRYKPHRNITNIKNTKLSLKNTTKLILYSTLACAPIKNMEDENLEENKSREHGSLLTEDFLGIEYRLTDLIKSLTLAISDTCEKYRNCLEKQMEIIEKGTNVVNESSAYWDQIVELRNEAGSLKRELETYQSLIKYVGQASFNLALCSALINSEDADKYICKDFFDLERVSNDEAAENKRVEVLLMKINMKSIFQGDLDKKVDKDGDKK